MLSGLVKSNAAAYIIKTFEGLQRENLFGKWVFFSFFFSIFYMYYYIVAQVLANNRQLLYFYAHSIRKK